MRVAKALGNLQICTLSTEHLWPVIAISTKDKCFGLFDLYFCVTSYNLFIHLKSVKN